MTSTPKRKMTPKRKISPKIKTTTKMKTTLKMKTTPKMKMSLINKDDLKSEFVPENEEDLKYEDCLRNEDDLKMKKPLIRTSSTLNTIPKTETCSITATPELTPKRISYQLSKL